MKRGNYDTVNHLIFLWSVFPGSMHVLFREDGGFCIYLYLCYGDKYSPIFKFAILVQKDSVLKHRE